MSNMWDGFSSEKQKQINKEMEEKYQGHSELLDLVVRNGGVFLHPDLLDDEEKYREASKFYTVDLNKKEVRRERDNFLFTFSYIRLERALVRSTFRLRVVFSKPVTESKPGFELICYKNEKLEKFSPTKDKKIDDKLTLLGV